MRKMIGADLTHIGHVILLALRTLELQVSLLLCRHAPNTLDVYLPISVVLNLKEKPDGCLVPFMTHGSPGLQASFSPLLH